MLIINRLKYPLVYTNGLVLLPSEKAGERDEIQVVPNEVTPEQWGAHQNHPDVLALIKAGKLEVQLTPAEKKAADAAEVAAIEAERQRLAKLAAPNSTQVQQQMEAVAAAAVNGLLTTLGVGSVDELRAKLESANQQTPSQAADQQDKAGEKAKA